MHIAITNQLTELYLLVDQLNQFGQQQGLPENVVNELVLISEELVSNTINHGYSDQQQHIIDITLTLHSQQLHLTITDDAKAFNPFTQNSPQLGQTALNAPIGGLGLPLVIALSDQQYYSYQQGKNCIEVVKNID